jgi:oligoendopeptidase F
MKKPIKNKGYKTEWNLGLLYKSAKDLQIEKDIQLIESECQKFAKKWKGVDLDNLETLLASLHDYEQFEEKIAGSKPFVFYTLSREIDTGNSKFAGLITKLQERFTIAFNETIFYALTIGKLPKKIQEQVVKDGRFAKYRYLLERLFINAKHQLSEPEEKILSLKRNPAYEFWVDMTEKALGELTVLWKGEVLPLTKASGMIATLNKQSDRKKLHGLVYEQVAKIQLLAEAEMNAVVNNKKIDDTLRGFAEPFEATLLDYQNTPAELTALMNAVKKYESLTDRLFTLKKKLMNVETLGAYDMAISLHAIHKKYSFDDAVAITRSAFEKVSPEYRAIFDSFLTNGQIDVYSRKGKKGGGYCWGDYGRPTYILLNWNDTFDAVRTLAHEMGHAIHAEYSNKHQGVLYHDHPISTAEVASTLFENFVRDELYATLSVKDQLFERFNYLQEAFMTIHRQVNHFQFEQEMYQGIYAKGTLSADEISKIRAKYLKRYMGKSVTLTETDGLGWIMHSHMRRFFYVYSYAYGQLISTAMYARYQQDKNFVEKINQFLSAGGSDTPANIFKSIGIDTTDPTFWETGLQLLESELKQLEKDCKKMGLI